VGDGPAQGPDISAEVVRRAGEIESSVQVTAGGGVLMQLGGVPVQATIVSGVPECGLIGGGGVGGRRGPEACRRDLVLAVVPAVLIEVVGEPEERLIAVPGAGGAGAGRAGADEGERPADAIAGDGRIGQGLLPPVPAQGVPFGARQVFGRGCFQERPRQADPHAQAAAIHRRVDERRRGGRGLPVAGQQLGSPGQELDRLPVLRPGGSLSQPCVPRLAESLQTGRCRRPGGRSGCPRTGATVWPPPAPGLGPGPAAVPAARRRPVRLARPPRRGRTGPHSATPCWWAGWRYRSGTAARRLRGA
jgi:hypothetical protein